MFGWWRRRRRAAVVASGWGEEAEEAFGGVGLVRRLPAEQRERLAGYTRVFLSEKRFEGCGGLVLSEPMKVAIAAEACVLLVGFDAPSFFPRAQTVLVYPASFRGRREEEQPDGTVLEEDEERYGESWESGAVVLAWEEVERELEGRGEGVNVVLHEFAHQLDQETGEADGAPWLPRELRGVWGSVMGAAFGRLEEAERRGVETVLDPYGASDPSEFFAVATEGFFEDPVELREEDPDLYALLRRYYRQDPASWGSASGGL